MPDKLAAADGGQAAAPDLPAGKGGGAAHGQEFPGIDLVSRVQIPDGEVLPQGDGKALSRVIHQQLQQLFHGYDSRQDQLCIQHGKGRFQAHDAEGAALQALRLLRGTVGRVVRGDHVHGAVQDPFDKGLPVLRGAEGRVHLEAAVLLQIVLVQHQIVGGGLAADVQALPFCLPDQSHALLRGYVADVVGAASLPDQLQVPPDLAPFALGADPRVAVGFCVGSVVDIAAAEQAIVLAVGGDQLPEALRLRHGRPHHFIVLHAPSVVGEGDHPGRQLFQIGQSLSPLAQGDGAVGIDLHLRLGFDQGLLRGQVFRAVRHRVQIRHGADGGITAPGRRGGAGGYGFLIRKARLAQMYMYIAKAG